MSDSESEGSENAAQFGYVSLGGDEGGDFPGFQDEAEDDDEDFEDEGFHGSFHGVGSRGAEFSESVLHSENRILHSTFSRDSEESFFRGKVRLTQDEGESESSFVDVAAVGSTFEESDPVLAQIERMDAFVGFGRLHLGVPDKASDQTSSSEAKSTPSNGSSSAAGFKTHFPPIKRPTDETTETPFTDKIPQQTTSSAMPSDQSDKIKTAMSKFTLPPERIPDWAKKIPEDAWLNPLMSKVAPPPKKSGTD